MIFLLVKSQYGGRKVDPFLLVVLLSSFSHSEVTFCLCDIYYRQCIEKLSFFVPIKQNGNKVPSDSWLSRPALQSEKLSEG